MELWHLCCFSRSRSLRRSNFLGWHGPSSVPVLLSRSCEGRAKPTSATFVCFGPLAITRIQTEVGPSGVTECGIPTLPRGDECLGGEPSFALAFFSRGTELSSRHPCCESGASGGSWLAWLEAYFFDCNLIHAQPSD